MARNGHRQRLQFTGRPCRPRPFPPRTPLIRQRYVNFLLIVPMWQAVYDPLARRWPWQVAERGPAGAAFASGSAAAAPTGVGSEGSTEVHQEALLPLAPLVLDWAEESDSLVGSGLPSIRVPVQVPSVSGVLRTVRDSALKVSTMECCWGREWATPWVTSRWVRMSIVCVSPCVSPCFFFYSAALRVGDWERSL